MLQHNFTGVWQRASGVFNGPPAATQLRRWRGSSFLVASPAATEPAQAAVAGVAACKSGRLPRSNVLGLVVGEEGEKRRLPCSTTNPSGWRREPVLELEATMAGSCGEKR